MAYLVVNITPEYAAPSATICVHPLLFWTASPVFWCQAKRAFQMWRRWSPVSVNADSDVSRWLGAMREPAPHTPGLLANRTHTGRSQPGLDTSPEENCRHFDERAFLVRSLQAKSPEFERREHRAQDIERDASRIALFTHSSCAFHLGINHRIQTQTRQSLLGLVAVD